MSDRKPPTRLACALSIVVIACCISACRPPAKEKLPVCPGDPRCESSLL